MRKFVIEILNKVHTEYLVLIAAALAVSVFILIEYNEGHLSDFEKGLLKILFGASFFLGILSIILKVYKNKGK